jgi:hypothetical protein
LALNIIPYKALKVVEISCFFIEDKDVREEQKETDTAAAARKDSSLSLVA